MWRDGGEYFVLRQEPVNFSYPRRTENKLPTTVNTKTELYIGRGNGQRRQETEDG